MSYERSSKVYRRSLKDIMAGLTTEAKKEEVSATTAVPEWARLKAFVPGADMSHKDVRDKLYKHAAFSDSKVVLVPGTKEAWKFSYSSMAVGADRTAHGALVAYYQELTEKKDPNAVVLEQCIRYVNNCVSSNGLLSGLIHRIVTQLPGTEPVLKPKPEELQIMTDYLPMIFEEIPRRPDWDDPDVFDITETADAGAPFMVVDPKAKCDATNLVAAVKLAEKYLSILEKDDEKLTKTNEYFREHPQECIFMLKRKLERMTWEAATTKVRPYYVPPLALKLLFMWVAHYIQDALKNHDEVETSGSSYKTTWFYGGTDRLMDFITDGCEEAVARDEVVFKFTCFGDDAFWMVFYPDGTYVILTPDVSAMDMHVAKMFGLVLQKLTENYYSVSHGKSPPLLFMRVLKLLCHMAFTTNLHIVGSFNMLKAWGLCSGIPLTTIFDMCASAYIAGIFTTSMRLPLLPGAKSFSSEKTYNAENLDALVKHVQRRVYIETSAKFKESTLVPYPYEKGHHQTATSYPFSYLGVKFQKITRTIKYSDSVMELEGWVPVPANIEKYAASYVFPTRQKTGPVQVMERIYGLMLSGAWITPLGPLLRREYERLLGLKNCPTRVDTTFASFGDVEEIASVLLSRSPELPSDDIIAAMYLLSPEDFGKLLTEFKPIAFKRDPVEKPELAMDMEDIQDMEELSLAFGQVKVAPRHAGQARLPKPKSVTSAAASAEVSMKLVATKPVLKKKGAGITKGGKQNRAMRAILEEQQDDEEDESESAESPDDY